MSGSSFSSSSSFSATTVMAHPSPPTKYHVFLSFRGADTRNNITTHLYDKLAKKNIETFIDNRLEPGDEILPELNKAIEESMIYVIIFSENYASSSWCLNELLKILEYKKKYDERHVIPVFYKVEPSTVRYQTGSYQKALDDHQKWVGDEVIQRWKVALIEAAGISGTSFNDTRPETMILDGIVEDISKKLNRSFSSTNDQGIVGNKEHIAQIQSMLQLESQAVRIIGIWGMGGIGKSTLAQALHNKLATQFSSRSCVINAQQKIERVGIDSVRKKYLSELLGEKIKSDELHFAIERVKKVKVLLILDDLKNSSQLQELIGVGGRGNFGQGSRIIVSSRDMQVLRNVEADEIYEVNEMNYHDSLELFSLNAFKQNHPVGGYADLVQKVLQYAKGIPLALKVLGLLLHGRKRKAWESELQKLEKLPDRDIFNVLKLSYDGLDDEQKDIFLDIACFFSGGYVCEVMDILDGCGFSAHIGMDVLKDKGLIYILEDSVVVHDLMQEMGMEIVRQQCANDPGKRSRLWKHEEIYQVLKNNKGTDAMQCIFIDDWKSKQVELHREIFKSMPNLRMLYIRFWDGLSDAILPSFQESPSDGLKVLYWDQFPLRSLVLDFFPENLVKLYMKYSHLEHWEDDQALPNLKKLDLSYSSNLIQIPDLSKFPNIEEVILNGCESLIKVYSSSFLSKLKLLWLNRCHELTSLNLYSNILSRSSGLVELYDCCKLETFSIEVVESRGRSHFDGFSGGIENFCDAKFCWTHPEGTSSTEEIIERDLDLSRGIYFLRKYEPSQYFHHELYILDLGDCESLTNLSSNIWKLKLLRRLYLSGCSNLEKLPEIEETMENLGVLVLDGTAIQELPSSLHRLVGLEQLSLRGCKRLEIIPSSIGTLTKLCSLDITYCESLETFPSSIFKLNLTELDFMGCSKLKTFPEIWEPQVSVSCINLRGTAIQELPSSLHRLVGLKKLSLRQCERLEIIPSTIKTLTKLCSLDITYCESLETFPSNIFKLNLTKLDFEGCSKLKTFPEILEPQESVSCINLGGTAIQELPSSLHRLVGLEELSLRKCKRLEIIPSIGTLTKLCKLDITYCESFETFPSSIFKLNLTELDFKGCSKLKTFPEILEPQESVSCINLGGTAIQELPSSLHRLVGLEKLSLRGCKRLEIIPSSIGTLTKLCNLDITLCKSLETFPSSIFKLNLTELDFKGCSKLKTIPEIFEPVESFACIELSNTPIRELPSSLDCCDLESLPNCLLPELDCLSSLRKLSLRHTGIVNLPESIAHLSSLESLDVSHCRKLEYIPQLPPFLIQLIAIDCPSIRRVISNSRFKHPSDFKEGSNSFELYFTSNEEWDPSVHSDVVADARLRVTEDAFRFVFYCFPGSAVPDWFPYRSQGNSLTVDKDSLHWGNDNSLIGFAICLAFGFEEDVDYRNYEYGGFRCWLTFESDARTDIFPNDKQLKVPFYWSYFQMVEDKRDHTFIWKYYLMDSANIGKGIFHAFNFTIELTSRYQVLKSSPIVKECGIRPLFTQEKDDIGGASC